MYTPSVSIVYCGVLINPHGTELFLRNMWPPPWETHRSHERISWDIIPNRDLIDQRCALLESLHADCRWMVYVDGSFVWRYNDPDHSSSGAGAYIAQLGQVVAYERLGLGSYTEPQLLFQ